MREMEFKMERRELLDVVKEGSVLPVKEYKLPNSYYYILGNAYGASANFKKKDRLSVLEGTVKTITETEKGFYVVMEFEE